MKNYLYVYFFNLLKKFLMGQLEELVRKKPKEEKPQELSKRIEFYRKNLQKFKSSIMDKEFTSDFLKLVELKEPSNDQVNSLINKYRNKAEKIHINKELLGLICTSLYGNSYIEKNLLEKDFKIFEFMKKDIFSKLIISETEKAYLKKVEQRFQKEFDDEGVSLINYDIDGVVLRNPKDVLLLSINYSLIYSESNKPNILNLVLNERLLSNTSLIYSLADFIRSYQNLFVVNFILYPIDQKGELPQNFGLDGLFYRMIYVLTDAINANRNIKCFLLHSVKDYKIVLPPEICGLILKKLQSETLVFLHMGNFVVSQKYLKKFLFQFSVTRSLVLLSIEDNNLKKNDILEMKTIFSKNKSLMGVSIVSYNLFNNMNPQVFSKIKENLTKQDKENEEKRIMIVHLGKDSLINFNSKEKK